MLVCGHLDFPDIARSGRVEAERNASIKAQPDTVQMTSYFKIVTMLSLRGTL